MKEKILIKSELYNYSKFIKFIICTDILLVLGAAFYVESLFSFLVALLFIILVFLADVLFVAFITSCEICVTEKRVYGKAIWRSKISLPLDSISSVGKGMFTIYVGTSSGKIRFGFIKNSNDIYRTIKQLLNGRQKKSQSNVYVADELIKLKKLLDDNVITKEEFEIQKKRLLMNI